MYLVHALDHEVLQHEYWYFFFVLPFCTQPAALLRIRNNFENIAGSGSTKTTFDAVKENNQLSMASVRVPSTSTHFGCTDSPFTMCSKSLIAPPSVLLELCSHT